MAAELRESNSFKELFDRPIPIIVHDLTYTSIVTGITKIANPNGEASEFLPDWLKV